MHLRSGKTLNKMTKSVNIVASMSSQSSQYSSQAQITRTSAPAMDVSVPTALGAIMDMPVSTKIGVTAPNVTAE